MTALLTDNLPLLAGAPNGIKKLRELILELAVRGKLVPQDPSDEPASELLKRIAEEKARLVAEGRIKKQKVLGEIGEEDAPFHVPTSWEWVRLGDSLEMINGRAFKTSDWKGVGLPIVRIQNLNRMDAPFNYCEESSVDDRHVIDTGTILISWSGTPGTSFGAFIWRRGKAALNQHIFSCLQKGDAFFDRFLILAINTRLDELIAKAHGGVGLQHVTKGKLEALTLAAPPLAEQHRIVAKVDELMALCDRLEARRADADSAHAQLVQALLGSLTQASDAEDFVQSWQRLAEHFHTLFITESSIDALKKTLLQLAVMGKLVAQDPSDESANELLKRIAAEKAQLVTTGEIKKQKTLTVIEEGGELFELPLGWRWARLGELCSKVTDGEHATPRRSSSGHYLLSARNVTNEGIFLNDVDFVPQDEFERIRKRCDPNIGDVLISCSGSIGRIAVVDRDNAYSMVRSVAMIRPVSVGTTPEFIARCLRSPALQTEMFAKSRQSAQANLFLGAISSLVMPVAPRPEQHRIVAKVDQLMALCDQLKSRLSEARQVNERLANALIGQALSGEKKSGAEAVDFSAYLISKLASRRTFGRVAHMKLLFLADSHLGLGLMDGYRRHAAGPLDTTIYRVEERAAQEGLYSTSVEVLKSGQEKVSYHIGANISRSVETAASALGAARRELDRLIALFEGRKTEDLEAVATLYAVWNDALAGGLQPNDEWLINEFRSNWHEAKERFTPDILGKWLGWMRDNGLVPTGNSAVTKSQAAFLFN
ncbi:restriction endonuclease subunit S [Xanthomonas campestris pv. raphani]|uniref:restriction endonuclease subunit S n=1 Tax=Xanthomonas campestris TaxID=339 RepID=UPI001E4725E9|nr:restriction endonuclease subunit S [Xanthomonas campestris]MCC8487893.1 restriction endonuclease subunit S [Xanthomonas campestris]MEA9650128.1 restriction endonuclease subunit S [Xanthomonas campestris pv. raphani]MEA9742840.1 restriction endonuclease subunit S [Xanthomonas campestris pv. raphani]MEA9768293.1 restriction endonuclease subunit S [Xanthomonas campestris pv. raphani]MEA9868373.1 restriction endonuclease subunit S [Xanthomonas campestris pv. raphani]